MILKALAAAALAVSAAASMAQETPPISLVLSPSGAGTSMASFERVANGFFLDTFTFTPAAVSGNVSVDLVPASGSISFFSALLNGQGFSFLPENGDTHFRFQSVVGSDQPLQLQVLGFAGDAGNAWRLVRYVSRHHRRRRGIGDSRTRDLRIDVRRSAGGRRDHAPAAPRPAGLERAGRASGTLQAADGGSRTGTAPPTDACRAGWRRRSGFGHSANSFRLDATLLDSCAIRRRHRAARRARARDADHAQP